MQDVITKSGKSGVTASAFKHASFPQNSVIARVQGKSNRTIVVGAHLDSINSSDRLNGRAPGVDDDGSGSMLLIEALRVLLMDDAVAGETSTLQNTVEFHWYAAEEGGLRGSQDVFTQYQQAGRDIWAMLQQDMVGYTKGTLNAGKPESFGLITDFTDGVLNEYVARVIGEVSAFLRLFFFTCSLTEKLTINNISTPTFLTSTAHAATRAQTTVRPCEADTLRRLCLNLLLSTAIRISIPPTIPWTMWTRTTCSSTES